jgi:hypothetical protein
MTLLESEVNDELEDATFDPHFCFHQVMAEQMGG